MGEEEESSWTKAKNKQQAIMERRNAKIAELACHIRFVFHLILQGLCFLVALSAAAVQLFSFSNPFVSVFHDFFFPRGSRDFCFLLVRADLVNRRGWRRKERSVR